jgi:hypothetical protein
MNATLLSAEHAKSSPSTAEGLGGGERRRNEQVPRKAAALITSGRTAEPLATITPTLTRPHQGCGNALTIYEYRSVSRGTAAVSTSP